MQYVRFLFKKEPKIYEIGELDKYALRYTSKFTCVRYKNGAETNNTTDNTERDLKQFRMWGPLKFEVGSEMLIRIEGVDEETAFKDLEISFTRYVDHDYWPSGVSQDEKPI